MTYRLAYRRFDYRLALSADTFAFRKDRPAHWLQRACLWMLAKLGCHALIPTPEPVEITYDTDRLEVFIHKQMADAHIAYGERAFAVVMNEADFYLLCTRTTGVLGCPSPDVWELRADPPRFYGLRVILVPWAKEPVIITERQWNGK